MSCGIADTRRCDVFCPWRSVSVLMDVRRTLSLGFRAASVTEEQRASMAKSAGTKSLNFMLMLDRVV